MASSDEIERYWQEYLAVLPGDSRASSERYVADQFGDSPELADVLSALVVSGKKIATCSSVWEWEAEGKPLPSPGLKTVVLDGGGAPSCIIETTEVCVVPYNEVDAAFAASEGEGDLSLEYWREAHWQYFTRALPRIGREACPDMPLVCEHFRLVYK